MRTLEAIIGSVLELESVGQSDSRTGQVSTTEVWVLWMDFLYWWVLLFGHGASTEQSKKVRSLWRLYIKISRLLNLDPDCAQATHSFYSKMCFPLFPSWIPRNKKRDHKRMFPNRRYTQAFKAPLSLEYPSEVQKYQVSNNFSRMAI